MAALFQNHQDLLEEFTHFLPDASATYAPHHAFSGRGFVQRDDRSSLMPTARHIHGDKVHLQFNFLLSSEGRCYMLSFFRADLLVQIFVLLSLCAYVSKRSQH